MWHHCQLSLWHHCQLSLLHHCQQSFSDITVNSLSLWHHCQQYFSLTSLSAVFFCYVTVSSLCDITVDSLCDITVNSLCDIAVNNLCLWYHCQQSLFFPSLSTVFVFMLLSVSLCSLHHCRWVFALYTSVSESLLFTPLSVSLCSLFFTQTDWHFFCVPVGMATRGKSSCTHHNNVTDWLCRCVLADLPVPAGSQCAHQSNTPTGWHILCVPVAIAAQTDSWYLHQALICFSPGALRWLWACLQEWGDGGGFWEYWTLQHDFRWADAQCCTCCFKLLIHAFNQKNGMTFPRASG